MTFPRALILALLALLAGATAAHARLVVVASGDANATLADVSTNRVINRVGLGGVTRAVAASPDGTRAYVAAGRRVIAVDLARQAPAGAITLSGTVKGLGVSIDGARLYAARKGALDIIDSATLAPAGAWRARSRATTWRPAAT